MRGINGDNLEAGIIDGQRVQKLVQDPNGKFFAVVQSGVRYAVDPEEFVLLSIAVQA